MNENVIEWLSGQTTATVTAPNSSKLKGMILRAKEKAPEEVQIIEESKDGTIMAHVPLEYVSVRKPRQMSEESKQRARENFFNNRPW